jgi:photosystem I subunit PsaO|tara:strand:+ start:485 stop:868 length:384 start_codon:yes stop_codon:yes gene_type:complete
LKYAGIVGTKVFKKASICAPRGDCVIVRAASNNNTFDDDWLKAEVPVHLLTLFGWTIPSASPCPAFENNNSLFFMLCQSVSENLSHFPTGPALDDKFWLYLITWHIGLFTTMLLGQIGYQGRKQGYF